MYLAGSVERPIDSDSVTRGDLWVDISAGFDSLIFWEIFRGDHNVYDFYLLFIMLL